MSNLEEHDVTTFELPSKRVRKTIAYKCHMIARGGPQSLVMPSWSTTRKGIAARRTTTRARGRPGLPPLSAVASPEGLGEGFEPEREYTTDDESSGLKRVGGRGVFCSH